VIGLTPIGSQHQTCNAAVSGSPEPQRKINTAQKPQKSLNSINHPTSPLVEPTNYQGIS
jgi:hypothetical protein